MEDQIVSYLLSLGLSLSLAILVAFRAGRLRSLNMENYEERLSDLAFDSLKAEINKKLHECFNLYFLVPNGQNYRFPGGLTIHQVAAQIHNDIEDLDILQNIYFDLVNQSLQSAYFLQALEFVLGGIG